MPPCGDPVPVSTRIKAFLWGPLWPAVCRRHYVKTLALLLAALTPLLVGVFWLKALSLPDGLHLVDATILWISVAEAVSP